MRKAFLKKARETLRDMRAQLVRNVQAELHEGREQSKDEGMDTYDLASDARDREINNILTDRDRERVQAIDEALGRIDESTYGVCESCESDIAEARLLALPFTRLCVTCQGEREKEAKMNRRADPDSNYRRFAVGDSDEGES
jgi:DnaK suppressor protein